MDKFKSNKNIKKKIAEGFAWVIVTLLFIPFILSLLSSQPLFQTFSARLVTMVLSDYTGYNININSIDFRFLKGIKAGGLSVDDKKGNTMLKIGTLKAVPIYADWKVFGIMFHEIEMDNVDFRLGKYTENDTLNFIKFINSFSSDTTTSESSSIFKLKIKKLKLSNTHFELFNKYDTSGNGRAMDFSNMDFSKTNIDIQNFKLFNDSLNFKIKNLSIEEKSGLKIDNLSMNFIISGTTINAEKLKGNLNKSKLDCDINLRYKSWGSMSYFLDSVQLHGNFRNTILNLSDIGYFAETMTPMEDKIIISGTIDGTVNNFNCKNIQLNFGKNSVLKGDIKIQNITDFNSTYYYADINKLSTNVNDLNNFKLPDGTSIPVKDYIDFKNNLNISGKFTGNYLNFNTDLTLENENSKIKSFISFYNKDSLTTSALIKGHIENIDRYIKQKGLFGNSDFMIEINGNGSSLKHVKLNSDITLLNTDILGYKYDSIHFAGNLHKYYKISGKFGVYDKNLLFTSILNLNLKDKNSYKIKADISRANFKKLNLLNEDFSLSTKAYINLKGTNINNITGDLKFDSTSLAFKGYDYFLKQIYVESIDSLSVKTISLKSDYIDADISGNFKLSDLYDNSISLFNSYLGFEEYKKEVTPANKNILLNLVIKNDRLLSEQFINNIRISPYSRLKGYMNFSDDSLNIELTSKLVKSGNIKIKNNNVKIFTDNKKLFLDFKSGFLVLKDSLQADTTIIGLENLNILASSSKAMTDFRITWHNTIDTTIKNYGKIKGYLFKKKFSRELSFDDAFFYAFDTLWTINKNNLIVFDTSGIRFNNFSIKGGNSVLSIKGKVPKKEGDSLSINFNNWNLSNLNPFIKSSGFHLGGFLNGTVEAMAYDTNFTFISNLKVKKFMFNDVTFGELRILNTWDNVTKSIFLKSQIIKKGNVGVGEIFSLDGFVYPFRKDSSLNLNSSFSRLNIAFLNPVLSDLFHNIKGKARGNLHLTGTFDQPILTGRVNLERTSMVVNYLNTKYSFTNYLDFEKNKINFNNLIIYDTLGNNAKVNGSITHNYFNDFGFNFKINTEKLLFVNTTKRLNDIYYGTVMASGKVHMWGDPEKLNLKIDTKTARGTNLSIPLDQAYSITNDFITFVPPPVDSTDFISEAEADFEKEITEDEMKYDIDINAEITPDARVNIYLPSDLGKIESQGHGNISLKASSEGEFTMFGDYIVDHGNFNFNFKNLISKRFTLVQGGKITWTGDPEDAYLNIKGLYKVKVNLSSLGVVVDSTSDYKNKQTVNCYITLKNRLLNPDVKFSIELPEADPDIRRMVYANLDTTNPAMVNEQMISLLVFGSFSFNNTNNFTMASQGYNILSNQLSSMLSKISNNFDIGMNYKPGDEITQQEFEVALSTQLFNDRLIINGNVGMTYDRSQKSTSNIIGDVDIMYKLTKDGRWLLKAFNHSNANSWYYYNNYDKISPYTQGVGIAYRKEFNNIAELFSRKRKKNKKENFKE